MDLLGIAASLEARQKMQHTVGGNSHASMIANVREAATGVDGLLEIGRTSPAVILLDYGLPDLNADQVIERLTLGRDAHSWLLGG